MVGNLTLAGTSRPRLLIKAAGEAEAEAVGVAKAEEEVVAVLLQHSLQLLPRKLPFRRILLRPLLWLDLLQQL